MTDAAEEEQKGEAAGKFLYAGNSAWEQQAFSFLEKESNDNSYKKVINLIGKMNRG